MELWNQLGFDGFWLPRLPDSRKGTGWLNVLKILVGDEVIPRNTAGVPRKNQKEVRENKLELSQWF